MTADSGTARAPRLLGLHVVFGSRARAPYADYECPCGHRDAAMGEAAVIRLVRVTGPAHLMICPLRLREDSR
ncbi:hypothetical protein VM95_19835 [Streptomyces rubellomurinus]|uniref:Uncharacterized protein n=1 Tax=Streptomyces rubellomurinus (strain ATCC 31215) TaxID=359131 RepID=A0A0F2TG31_STRR3|nr:hypothetical protein VM95_19835 [Streptomyces rubellomurinus]